MKRLLDYDPFTGITQWFHYDPLTDVMGIESVQDVQPFLEANKKAQTDGTNGWVSKDKEFRKAASIPNLVIEKWLKEDGIDVFNPDHWPAVKRKLNSNEWRHLRTALYTL